MDIEKWYPRTIPKPSAKVIGQMVEESEVVFEGVDYDKVGRYLGEFLDKDEIKSAGLEEIVYTKKKVQRKQKKKTTLPFTHFTLLTFSNQSNIREV